MLWHMKLLHDPSRSFLKRVGLGLMNLCTRPCLFFHAQLAPLWADKCLAGMQSGTALVSGFSGQLLKLFMSSTLEDLTPLTLMREALTRYDSWVVVD